MDFGIPPVCGEGSRLEEIDFERALHSDVSVFRTDKDVKVIALVRDALWGVRFDGDDGSGGGDNALSEEPGA